MSAFIYAMGEPGDDLIKIGRSAYPEQRLQQIRSKTKQRALALVHCEPTDNPVIAERWAQKLLQAERIYRNEEWFLVSPARAVEALKRAAYYATPRGWFEVSRNLAGARP